MFSGKEIHYRLRCDLKILRSLPREIRSGSPFIMTSETTGINLYLELGQVQPGASYLIL